MTKRRISTPSPTSQADLSRRKFLGTSGLALGGLALGPALLAACSSDSSGGDASSGDNELWFDNWTLYIDKPEGELYGKGGTLDSFQKASGQKIKYTEGINDNNEYFAKIQPLLSQDKPIGPDIIALTFW
ncbi:MAG: twin-arginine translocation signal domain-containing protein, partial [Actinobacteria bacterium]|nr:twin-arginine translocation signal domain-containing protein [Actinomycetota bacterium]